MSDYEFQEYPKWVEGKDGPVIVHSAEEEVSVKPAESESP